MINGKSRSSPRTPRAVDHVVLPVAALAEARERMTRLGFTVAADARHPFGTENCCVYLADGTYLEPLAIAQREDCERAAMRGNVFVARDQAYRFRRGETGFSGIGFSTLDAKSDHTDFVRKGMSAGRMLRFKRKFQSETGDAEAQFALSFAGDLRAPDMLAFTCQRVNFPDIDKGRLTRHKNGARALREIVLGESNPTDFQYFLQEIVNQRDQTAHSFGLELQASNATISTLNPRGLLEWFGVEASEERGLVCRGLIVGVGDLARLEQLFSANGVEFGKIENRVVVPPASGQGAFLAFEAAR